MLSGHRSMTSKWYDGFLNSGRICDLHFHISGDSLPWDLGAPEAGYGQCFSRWVHTEDGGFMSVQQQRCSFSVIGILQME